MEECFKPVSCWFNGISRERKIQYLEFSITTCFKASEFVWLSGFSPPSDARAQLKDGILLLSANTGRYSLVTPSPPGTDPMSVCESAEGCTNPLTPSLPAPHSRPGQPLQQLLAIQSRGSGLRLTAFRYFKSAFSQRTLTFLIHVSVFLCSQIPIWETPADREQLKVD